MSASEAKTKRISIGFQGGQTLPARVSAAELAAFEQALERAAGWHSMPCEDATVRIDLSQVVFVRVDSDEPRVGFGA
ncbi:MAG: hypothetical protein ACR2ND_03825 [Solirubrobacteraceae bacterium]